MGEHELKLNVSAPGAKEAAKDVQAVGQAAAGVTAPASSAAASTDKKAGADKAAAAAAGQHREALGTVKEGLAKLGPEGAMAGDMLSALTLKQGGAAMAAGVMGIAVLGLVKLYQSLTAAQEDQEKASEAAAEALRKQADAYADIAKGIEAVLLAERQQRGAGILTMPPEQAVQRLAKASDELVPGVAGALGKEQIQRGAEAVVFLPDVTDEQLRLFAIWMAAGGDAGEDDPVSRAAMFGQFLRSPAEQEKARKIFEAQSKDFPTLGLRKGLEGRAVAKGATPEAMQEDVLAAVAKDMGLEPKDLRRKIEHLLAASQELPGGKEARELADLVSSQRDLAGIRVNAGTRIANQGNPYGMPFTMGIGEIVPEGGRPLGTVINFNGGTHYHGQLLDQAGQRNTDPSK